MASVLSLCKELIDRIFERTLTVKVKIVLIEWDSNLGRLHNTGPADTLTNTPYVTSSLSVSVYNYYTFKI